jgi:hypothetical protein
MPIVNIKPNIPTTPTQDLTPKVFSPVVKSNVVDTEYQPVSSLLTFVEGSLWTINYYGQIVDESNALRPQDDGKEGAYQQYKKIENFQLKVSNSLSWSQDSTNKQITAQGNAYVHSLMIPLEGDMFAADVGDGREGVFQVTLSEKKSILKQSVYYIEYVLAYFSDASPSKRADLEKKVVQELVYQRDFLSQGQDPFLSKKEYSEIQELAYYYTKIIEDYMGWFFSKEFSTLIIPQQNFPVYDPFVTKLFMQITETLDHERIRYIRQLNLDDDYFLKQPQLFSVILEGGPNELRLCNSFMTLVSTSSFNKHPQLDGAYYSGIRRVVYPKMGDTPVDYGYNRLATPKPDTLTSLENVPTASGYVGDIIYADEIDFSGVNRPLIYPVLKDQYYALSQAFYTNAGKMSVLESLTHQLITNQAIDLTGLLQVARTYRNWGGLERFYYLPIILCLIKAVKRQY